LAYTPFSKTCIPPFIIILPPLLSELDVIFDAVVVSNIKLTGGAGSLIQDPNKKKCLKVQ
jgi:hypothetical protein